MLVNVAEGSMEPLFMANSLLRRRRFEECVKVCTEILEKNPYDQVAMLHRDYMLARKPLLCCSLHSRALHFSACKGRVVYQGPSSYRADVRG